jgi:hypothetical protein
MGRRAFEPAWAWAVVALGAGLVLLGIGIGLWSGRSAGRIVSDTGGVALVLALALPPLGALVLQRHGPRRVGWLLIAIGACLALTVASSEWARAALISKPGSLALGDFASWVQAWSWLPGWALAITLLPILLPDGGTAGMRGRLAFASLAFTVVAAATFAALSWHLRGPLLLSTIDDDPRFATLNAVSSAGFVVLGLLTLLALGSLVRRFRRASPEVRRQIAWVVYGATVAAAEVTAGVFLDLGNLFSTLAAVALAGGIAVAMLRYRLYDINTVVNRTLVYGALTATLAATYVGTVLLLQQAFDWITNGSQLAVAGSTLLVAAAFGPARRRIQLAVDRRFYRHKYDAARTLEAFSRHLRLELDVDATSAELVNVVTAAMQPAHASLWLRGTD